MKKKRILEKYNGMKLGWLHDSILFIVLLVAIFVIFRFIIGISVIGGESMYPGLKDGDIVVYLRTVKEYHPGDVISMRVPSGEYYVKRIAACGGDVVEVDNGSVYVNGELLVDEHSHGSTEKETGAVIYPYKVRDGNVFVLGDNREESMDSRAFGEVNLRQIKGRIIFAAGSDGFRKIGD